MHFTYCPYCGEKSVKKEIGDEGWIPYCNGCQIPLWDMFTTSIICAVVNEYNEVALLRQNYVSTTKYVCVAGIMQMGENAEETAKREIKEELGLEVLDLKYIQERRASEFRKLSSTLKAFKNATNASVILLGSTKNVIVVTPKDIRVLRQ